MFLAEASVLTKRRLPSSLGVSSPPGILARGPWPAARVAASWRDEQFVPGAEREAAADEAIAALADRGSPAHDGVAARLVGWRDGAEGLQLELQPMRWALRLVEGAADALSVLCVVRDASGRWLAGRRADWVATWAGRWALGAGGSVEVGEDPVHTLTRELAEEWSLVPDRLAVEALVRSPGGMAMLVGQAWLDADEPEVARDPEHDAHAWWPADVEEWPEEAHPALRTMARLLDAR
jgi:ADP-ribose pyrophosphatase YjhB (NUDIX family)